jgi:hypothetical protein
MKIPEEDAKHQVADVINAAINSVLSDGPDNDNVLMWQSRIEMVLDQNAPVPMAGATIVQEYNNNLFKDVVRYREFPVRSISGDAEGSSEKKSIDGFSQEEFASNILPELSELLERSATQTIDAAERFRASWIQAAVVAFQKWANTIPFGGTKDKSYRAAAKVARSDVMAVVSWPKRFLIIHRTDFMSEANHLFACKHGAIAGKWEFSPHLCDMHEALDGQVFVSRDSWAMEGDHLDPSKCRFFDQVPVPGSNGCLCSYEYLHDLQDVADYLLSAKDRTALHVSRVTPSGDRHSVQSKPKAKVPWWTRIFSSH